MKKKTELLIYGFGVWFIFVVMLFIATSAFGTFIMLSNLPAEQFNNKLLYMGVGMIIVPLYFIQHLSYVVSAGIIKLYKAIIKKDEGPNYD